MPEIEVNRHSHLIDPTMHVWGWEVPVYLFLGGVVAGIMIFSAILLLRRGDGERSRAARWMVFLAPVLLSVGMLALFLDLEYKWHVWRFYLAFEVTSPMSWGSWILLLIYPATLLFGFAQLTAAELQQAVQAVPLSLVPVAWLQGLHRWAAQRLTSVAWTNLVLGVGLGIYTGILLGSLGARPAWNSAVLGPLFLVSGVSTGAALILLLPMQHAEHTLIQRWDIGAILIEVTLLGVFFMALLTGGGQTGRAAAGLFLGGPYTAVFWSLVVIAGLAVPFALEVIEVVRRRRPTVLAPILLLVGGLALRWIIVAAGQAL